MEERRTVQTPVDLPQESHLAAPKSRRASVIGVVIRLLVAIAILASAGWAVYEMIASKPAGIQRQQRERTFTVEAMNADYGTFQTRYEAYGSVAASLTQDVRSQVQGDVTAVSGNLEPGSTVKAGEEIAAVDPYNYSAAVTEAQAALADARLTLSEAQAALKLQQLKKTAAEAALAAASKDLERAKTLNQSGALTDKEVDTRALTVSDRQQALDEIGNAIFTQQATIDRQTATIAGAELDLEKAKRDQLNTSIKAPFTGVVVSSNVGLGAYITANETVASLYDPKSLDVRFTVSDLQYGQLLAGGLTGSPISATWEIDPDPVTVTGEVTRTDPEVDSATGGVTLYARLTGDNAYLLRPGTFVKVGIDGPKYEHTLRVPETAVYESNHIYTIRDGRMAKVDAEIKARDNDHLIIAADVPDGERIITTRLSQAGEGVAVAVAGDDTASSGDSAIGANGELPQGAVKRDDGSIVMPNGNIVHPDGSIERPDGTVISAEEAAKLRQSGGFRGGPPRGAGPGAAFGG